MYVADWGTGLQIIEFPGAGIEEGRTPHAGRNTPDAGPTIIHGVLGMPLVSSVQRKASGVLLDGSGRKVLGLKPGPNDVSRLAPGVYFCKSGPSSDISQPSAFRKVVLTR